MMVVSRGGLLSKGGFLLIVGTLARDRGGCRRRGAAGRLGELAAQPLIVLGQVPVAGGGGCSRRIKEASLLRCRAGTGVPGAPRPRPRSRVCLGHSGLVSTLLDSMRRVGAHEQAAALADRLPTAGMFGRYLNQHGRADQFHFGREADGSPRAPWAGKTWTYHLLHRRQELKKPARRSAGCPLEDRLPGTPEHRLTGRAACGNAVSYHESAR